MEATSGLSHYRDNEGQDTTLVHPRASTSVRFEQDQEIVEKFPQKEKSTDELFCIYQHKMVFLVGCLFIDDLLQCIQECCQYMVDPQGEGPDNASISLCK